MFLIQYVSSDLPEPPVNPNSASALTALFIAVKDLHSATGKYGIIANTINREISIPAFGAVAKEIVLQRGRIFLLAASDPAGPTARRLKAGGEGILGAEISVKDLGRAGKRIGKRNISNDPQLILVPPEDAGGVWLEFRQTRK